MAPQKTGQPPHGLHSQGFQLVSCHWQGIVLVPRGCVGLNLVNLMGLNLVKARNKEKQRPLCGDHMSGRECFHGRGNMTKVGERGAVSSQRQGSQRTKGLSSIRMTAQQMGQAQRTKEGRKENALVRKSIEPSVFS